MQQLVTFAGNHWELVLALVVISVLLIGTTFVNRLRGVRSVVPTEAIQLINHENALMLDVRENNEFADGHIIDSVHVPLSALAGRLEELDDYRARTIVVSCRSGQRSGNACALLKKQGFENVFNLRGGVMAWRNDNLPLAKK